MHKDSTTQAKQKKDEREEVLKEIRQLENRQKILENKQRNEERRVRTRRLIERGAVLEGIFPLAPDLSGAEVNAILIALSHLPGPCRGRCVLRPRWEATLPKPLVRSAQPNTRFAVVRLHRACYPLTERRCSP